MLDARRATLPAERRRHGNGQIDSAASAGLCLAIQIVDHRNLQVYTLFVLCFLNFFVLLVVSVLSDVVRDAFEPEEEETTQDAI